MRLEPVVSGLLIAFTATAATNPLPVTFTKDVAPILQKNCQGCHRPGEAAPFSLLTYEQARPWAKAMKEAVLLKKMPPWFADPHYGKFANDRSLSQKDIDTLVAWADAGAPAGRPQRFAGAVEFIEGWRIPGSRTWSSRCRMRSTSRRRRPSSISMSWCRLGLHEDRWVQFAEARPGNRAHWCITSSRLSASRDSNG